MPFNVKHLIHRTLSLFAGSALSVSVLASGIGLSSDIAYGEYEEQKLDVYYPTSDVEDAPVIFMVHGGAWRVGDKASRSVVKNKVAHWVPKGFVFISVNYRMLPNVGPIEQSKDVEKALLFSQKNARQWGGSPEKFILMGHSAGAHLISLLAAREATRLATKSGTDATPWMGAVALDTAAYDIENIMRSRSAPRAYKRAFGDDAAYWRAASPSQALQSKLPPFLVVCSSTRKDKTCMPSKQFVERVRRYGGDAQLLSVAFTHREINEALGADNCYTQSVDAFMKKLHPSIEPMLTEEPSSHLSHEIVHKCADI